ncbi:proton-conducting transporter membrane subunit [Haliangium sp.]|uniref:proton-conducting transporter transmembrane domain-containing protein n=1 Tax=Haliangium sp. TaxID=2663208 RepID=UPI003D0F4C22
MSILLALLTVVAPFGAGLLCLGARPGANVRPLGLWASALSILSAGALLLLTVVGALPASVSLLAASPTPWLPLFAALIGLVTVAMNPVATGPGTFVRILMLSATTLAASFVREPLVLAVLWVLQLGLVLLELRSRGATRSTARLCAVYLVPSGVLAVAAAVLLGQGAHTLAVGALVFAIAIRTAMMPLHSWFPEFVEHAPLGTVVAFVCPLMGVHFFTCLFQNVDVVDLSTVVPVVAVVTAVLAGALGVVQVRARRALAYVLMSKTALVVFGLGTITGGRGAAISSAWLVVGLSTAGFGMVMAALEARRGTLLLDRPTGNYERIPLLATAFFVLGLASVGLPGTFGFVADELLFGAAFGERPWLTLTLVASTALNAVTVLRCFFLLFMGRRDHTGELDLLPREWIALTVLTGVLIVQGLWPSAGLRLLSTPESGPDHARSAYSSVVDTSATQPAP